MTPEVLDGLERAWLEYLSLSIPGKGDGAHKKYKYSRAARLRLEEEYETLDPAIRKAKEVALARYDGFAMRKDGTLDYHTGDQDGLDCLLM
jgi:hypothetical protein